jgi:hypothetical protein
MTIVFACPKCGYVMQAPDEKGGVRVKCKQCTLTQEIPLPKGKLIEVRPAPGSKPGIKPKSNPSMPRPNLTLPPRSKAEDLLEQAAARREAGELDTAVKLLRQAYDCLRQENRAFPVDTYLLLPLYLQQAGQIQEGWDYLHHLLFRGYPNQTHDRTLIAQDRAKVLDRMRQYLEADNHHKTAAVFEGFSMVFKGIALYRDNRARELKVWFSRENCTEFLHTFKRYEGNLGRLQELHAILIEEIGQYPELDFERLGERVESALARG